MAFKCLFATIFLALVTYSSTVFTSDNDIVIKTSTVSKEEVISLYQAIYGKDNAQKKWQEYFFSPFDAQQELKLCLRISRAIKNRERSSACEKALSLFESQ